MIGSNLYGDYGGWDSSRPTTQDERGAGTGWLLRPGISRKAHGVHECACNKNRHLLDSGMAWAASFASVSGLWAPYFGSWLQARHVEPPGLS